MTPCDANRSVFFKILTTACGAMEDAGRPTPLLETPGPRPGPQPSHPDAARLIEALERAWFRRAEPSTEHLPIAMDVPGTVTGLEIPDRQDRTAPLRLRLRGPWQQDGDAASTLEHWRRQEPQDARAIMILRRILGEA